MQFVDYDRPATGSIRPTDLELIKDYLFNMVYGNPPLSTDDVFNIDVYGDQIELFKAEPEAPRGAKVNKADAANEEADAPADDLADQTADNENGNEASLSFPSTQSTPGSFSFPSIPPTLGSYSFPFTQPTSGSNSYPSYPLLHFPQQYPNQSTYVLTLSVDAVAESGRRIVLLLILVFDRRFPTMGALNDEVRGERPGDSRFEPSDRELVDCLYMMVNGIPVPDNYPVYSMDIYGERNWRTLFETSADEDTFYFYTPLKQRTGNDSRKRRGTGDGKWRNQQHPKPIKDDQQQHTIGTKGNFSFIPKDGFPENSGRWVMHEYRLYGRYAQNLDSNRYGLCRIREKRRKGSSAADANGIPADYDRPDDEDMSVENWLRDVIRSPKN
ncbi:hypothetical protein EZV62_006292 [Acer yangbiense]|uniref:NAC domain-containing protein n=1 Tax=Acer yangbiense TaxID=1000413 RepID=A0A5C7IPP1_9ROSI|nr:hypothetical protein EZV62_006292 [Acer yangbiense]